jgi:hypothetical protein
MHLHPRYLTRGLAVELHIKLNLSKGLDFMVHVRCYDAVCVRGKMHFLERWFKYPVEFALEDDDLAPGTVFCPMCFEQSVRYRLFRENRGSLIGLQAVGSSIKVGCVDSTCP